MDGREPDVMLTRHVVGGGLHDMGRAGRWRSDAAGRWQQPGGPAQAQLNQQHQHKRTRFDPPAAWSLPAGYSVSVFRGRRLDLCAWPATLRSSAGFAGSSAQAASTFQRFWRCSKLLFNQALTRPRW